MRRLVVVASALGLFATLMLSSSALAQQQVMVTIGPGRNEATGTGTATLTDMGGKTRVELNVGAASPNMPAHIHADACPGVGPVVFPLSNVMNGMSVTEIDAPLSEILARGNSINVHKSPQEAGVYVGCGNLPASAPARAGGPALGLVAGALAAMGAGLLGAGVYARRRKS